MDDSQSLATMWHRLLPIDGSDRLLPALARVWRETSGCDRAAAIVVPTNSPRRSNSPAIHGPRTLLAGISDSVEGDRLVRAAVAGVPEDPTRLVDRLPDFNLSRAAISLALPPCDEFAGCVVLEGGSSERTAAVRSVADGDLAAAVALIRQAILMDQPWRNRAAIRWLEAEKLEAMAEFAAGAGHEINNPVATIAGRAKLLLDGERDPEKRHALAVIGGQALRIRDMIGDAMLFARPPKPSPQPLDLAAVLRREHAALLETASSRRVGLELQADVPTPIFADRTQLAVVVHALTRNAAEAMAGDGIVRIAVEPGRRADGPTACMFVEDSGPGLTETDCRHLFDPFYSGRQAGRGLGFGLPKCRRIVEAHGGTIDVESTASGVVVRVEWPATEGLAASGPLAAMDSP